MPPNPPSKRVALPRAAWRFAPCKLYPNFSRKILNPPRNEILDTPLVVSIVLQKHYFHVICAFSKKKPQIISRVLETEYFCTKSLILRVTNLMLKKNLVHPKAANTAESDTDTQESRWST